MPRRTWLVGARASYRCLLDVPYPTTPSQLYRAEDLAAGFAAGGFEAMYDTVVFRHFTARGGPLPDVREALAQRLHDAGIDSALSVMSAAWDKRRIVGVMGGHAVPRGAPPYRLAAVLAQQLTRAGRLVATGGGPGVMEAANLGSFLHRCTDDGADRGDRSASQRAELSRPRAVHRGRARRTGSPPGRRRIRRRTGHTDLAVRTRTGEPVRRGHRQILLQRHPGRHTAARRPRGCGLRTRGGRAPSRKCSRPRPRRSTGPMATVVRWSFWTASTGQRRFRSTRCSVRCLPQRRRETSED